MPKNINKDEMIKINKEIGNRIHIKRKELDLTLKELGDAVGISDSTVLRYERGEIYNKKMPVLESFARALNVNPAWIVGKSDDEKLSPDKLDDESFYTAAAHKVGHTGDLTDEEKESVDLAIQVALARHKRVHGKDSLDKDKD